MSWRLLSGRGAVLRLAVAACLLAALGVLSLDQGEAQPQTVVIEVNEAVGVSDAQQSLPPASVEQGESVTVSDSLQVLPPVSIQVNESVGVADSQQALPPASAQAAEGVQVSDQVSVVPPAVLQINETIGVSDSQQVVPPAVIQVNETIGVTDVLGDSDGDGANDLADNCATKANANQADSDADHVGSACDNCPATNNGPAERFVLGAGYQTDSDGDGVPGVQPPTNGIFGGDACDVDDDNDGIPDTSDTFCRTAPEDADGYLDSDGCPDPDNDLDGICDAGQLAPGCSGADVGKYCFDPAGTLNCNTVDCRNVAEDIDAFKDTDGCAEPDNDNDSFPDVTDDCPGTDSIAGPNGMLGAAQDLNHNGVRDGAEAVLTTDDVVLVFEDFDGVLDTDGCHDSPGDDFDGDGLTDDSEVFTHYTLPHNPDSDADGVIDGPDNCRLWPNPSQTVPAWALLVNDSDCDGFINSRETYLTTNPTKHCAATAAANDEATPDFWPLDMNDNRQINTVDVGAFVGKLGLDNTELGWTARLDLNQSANGLINTVDVGLYVGRLGNVCSPSGP